MIENVEDFGSKLNVEPLRDSLNVVILKQREVQRCDAWTDQDIASYVSPKVETWQSRKPTCSVQSRILWVVDRDLVVIRVDQTGRRRVTVRIPESKVRRRWNLETFRLDIPRRVPGSGERLTAGSTQSVDKCPV